MPDLLVVLGSGLLTVVVLMTLTALWARSVNRVAVVDITWGAGFVVVAAVCALAGYLVDAGSDLRALLLLVLVALWGGRLAWFVRGRAVGEGEDPRYRKLLGGTIDEVGLGGAVRRVFAVQGVAMWLVSLPVMVGVSHGVADGWGWWVAGAGVVVWLVGLVFEAVGDAQMKAYKAVPKAERAPVMDRGLWRYTRHPNYFGDSCVWWGLWLVGGLATGWLPGLLTLLAPVAMTYFLAFATGARLLEREMMKRDGYPEYAERTSMFVPLPPKRG